MVIQSDDLDFVLRWTPDGSRTEEALAALGFLRKPKDAAYRHPATSVFVEFVRGPLAIGDEILRQWDTLREGGQTLHLLTPTDSCRDRLAAFYHWNDRNALRQALFVAQAQRERIDVELIRRWSDAEGHSRSCVEFLTAFGVSETR
ncbi:MAG: hypothetical protein GC161_10840 [Planctomycetaceae bacterium]|nr:hypothetical protein [Planctomycetaceae bacterium]